jgi:hypothetical protein
MKIMRKINFLKKIDAWQLGIFVVVISLFSVILSLILLFLNYKHPNLWEARGEVSASLTSSLAVLAAVIAIFIGLRVQSSEHKSTEDIKTDLIEINGLLNNLISIFTVIKANYNSEAKIIKSLDLSPLKDTLNRFLISSTYFGLTYYFYINQEKTKYFFRVFALDLTYIQFFLSMQGEGRDISKITIPEHAIAEVRAALNSLKEKDIEEIASYMSSSLIKLIEKNNEIMNENPLIKLFQELMEEKDSDNIFSVDMAKAEKLISGISNVELKNNLTEILDKAKNNDNESKVLLSTVIEKFSLKDK